MVGIYKITNPNNRIYIGQSWNIESRLYSYKNGRCKNQRKLLNSIKKYGWENHKTSTFNLLTYKIELIKQLKSTIPVIKWNNTIKTLLNTSTNENDKFK